MEEIRPADAKTSCARLIGEALAKAWPEGAHASIVLDRPKDAQHGDFACNVALQLARVLKRSPRDIAKAIVEAMPASPLIGKAEVAGAGFINFFLDIAFKQRLVNEILVQGAQY